MADALTRSWQRAWRGIGAAGAGLELRAALQAAYEAPARKYHTLQHLRECLALFERHRSLAGHAAEVELALWFHDAVHEIGHADNEAQSAEWARRALRAAGVAPEAIERVVALVLATRHSEAPRGADAQLLVDIDLAILGASPPRFDEYEAQIRAEYAHVPDAEFRPRRRALLAAFLARDRLYSTAPLRSELEASARANLTRSIEALGS